MVIQRAKEKRVWNNERLREYYKKRLDVALILSGGVAIYAVLIGIGIIPYDRLNGAIILALFCFLLAVISFVRGIEIADRMNGDK